ncbi:metallophosphoesterase family protein [Seohaeicola zhoushanensis]
MRRIAHLSDLHFGRDNPELLEPLVDRVNALNPDLVAISGDFTQRALHDQFREARAFIDRIAAPTLSVPGNHDVPLYNLIFRVFWPWRRYRKWIDRQLEPDFADDEMIVIGVNTVNNLAHQSGWFRRRALRRVRQAFRDTHGRRVRIVVAHHPLEHLPGEPKKPMHGAAEAIEELARLKTDVILSGHLHSWRAAPLPRRRGAVRCCRSTPAPAFPPGCAEPPMISTCSRSAATTSPSPDMPCPKARDSSRPRKAAAS